MKISLLLLPLTFVHSIAFASMSCEESPASTQIAAQRLAFNQAIIDADIEAMGKVLAPDVVLITGNDSDLYSGKEAQLSLWAEDAKNGDARTVCDRQAQCIQLTSNETMAMESGQWICSNNGQPSYQGIYSAKWRKIEDRWQIEAELFMTTEEF